MERDRWGWGIGKDCIVSLSIGRTVTLFRLQNGTNCKVTPSVALHNNGIWIAFWYVRVWYFVWHWSQFSHPVKFRLKQRHQTLTRIVSYDFLTLILNVAWPVYKDAQCRDCKWCLNMYWFAQKYSRRQRGFSFQIYFVASHYTYWIQCNLFLHYGCDSVYVAFNRFQTHTTY